MMRSRLLVFAVALICGTAVPAEAAFNSVTSRVALAGTDFIDWGNAGPVFSQPSNSFTINSNLGVTATVSQSGTNPFERRNQGNGWNGDFASGDRLLWTNGNNGPVTIDFGTAVSAAGAQLHTNFFGEFTARIEALDGMGNVLFSSDFFGTSIGAGNNSAPFAGIVGTGGDTFTQIRFTGLTATSSPNDFAINQLDFTPLNAPAVVPVPAGALLMGIGAGFCGLAGIVRRRRAVAPTA